MSNSSISSATTPDQSGPGNDANEEIPRIPQNSIITGASPLDYLKSYSRHLLAGS